MSFYRFDETGHWPNRCWDDVQKRTQHLFDNRVTHHPDGEPMEVDYPGDPNPRMVAWDRCERQAIDEQIERENLRDLKSTPNQIMPRSTRKMLRRQAEALGAEVSTLISALRDGERVLALRSGERLESALTGLMSLNQEITYAVKNHRRDR